MIALSMGILSPCKRQIKSNQLHSMTSAPLCQKSLSAENIISCWTQQITNCPLSHLSEQFTQAVGSRHTIGRYLFLDMERLFMANTVIHGRLQMFLFEHVFRLQSFSCTLPTYQITIVLHVKIRWQFRKYLDILVGFFFFQRINLTSVNDENKNMVLIC